MAEARSRAAWDQTASVLALLANVHRDPKKTSGYKPSDFHPFASQQKPTIQQVGVSVLKQVFVERKK